MSRAVTQNYLQALIAGFTHSTGDTSHRIISPHFLNREDALGYIESIPDLPADVKIWRTTAQAYR